LPWTSGALWLTAAKGVVNHDVPAAELPLLNGAHSHFTAKSPPDFCKSAPKTEKIIKKQGVTPEISRR
jgi:hypothetical protein